MRIGQPSPISVFHSDEIIKSGSTDFRKVACSINVPRGLVERRIYLYVEVTQSTPGPFILGGVVRLLNESTPVAIFPAAIGDFTGLTINQSIASILSGGGSPVGDSLVVRLAQPFSVPAITLQPLRVNAECNRIEFGFESVYHDSGTFPITGWRAFLACLSTKY